MPTPDIHPMSLDPDSLLLHPLPLRSILQPSRTETTSQHFAALHDGGMGHNNDPDGKGSELHRAVACVLFLGEAEVGLYPWVDKSQYIPSHVIDFGFAVVRVCVIVGQKYNYSRINGEGDVTLQTQKGGRALINRYIPRVGVARGSTYRHA